MSTYSKTGLEHSAIGRIELKYALITPARNEAALIEQTIKAVVSQTRLPEKWVIVSDGSTDGTDEIVGRYMLSHSWIELVRMPERRERHFAGKVHAFKAGYTTLSGLDYDVIGNLDADITFDKDYFAFLLQRIAENPRLGVTGTPFTEDGRQYDYRFTSLDHVSGACQLFRRQCFEDIGGYEPIKAGGVDLVAVIKARMKGWQTRTFLERSCFHHRLVGSAKHNRLVFAYIDGRGDYTHGCDPLWQISRCVYQMTRPPILLKGLFCLSGFLGAMLTNAERAVSPDVIHFRKAEQRRRLRGFIRNAVTGRLNTLRPTLLKPYDATADHKAVQNEH